MAPRTDYFSSKERRTQGRRGQGLRSVLCRVLSQHQLAAVQKLCETVATQKNATDSWVELLVSQAGMAKLADAADLKSAGPQGLWGFKSPSRHQTMRSLLPEAARCIIAAMSTAALATILQDLEDELFYAILDVAQDIDQSLTVQAPGSPIWIEAFREIVRYDILYPAHSKALKYRYIDFRQKGLLALQKQSAIGPGQFRQAIATEVGSEDGWMIAEVDRARFAKLLTALKAEQSRRERGQQLAPHVHNAAVRLLQLAESFHR